MATSSTYSVLIVGAETESLKIIQEGLSAGGIQTHVGTDTPSAVALIEQTEVHAILVFRPSAQLREYGIVARLRELVTAKHLPIVACVDANVEVLARGAGDMLGIQKFVQAPPDVTSLIQTLTRSIEEHRVLVASAEESDGGGSGLNVSKLKNFHLKIASMDFFERLGVTPADGVVMIRQGFKDMATLYSIHNLPEKNRENKRMIRDIHHLLGEAYKVLTDATLRKKYERSLQSHQVKYAVDESVMDANDEIEDSVDVDPNDEIEDSVESVDTEVIQPLEEQASLAAEQIGMQEASDFSLPEPEKESVPEAPEEPEEPEEVIEEPVAEVAATSSSMDFDSMTARFRDDDESPASTGTGSTDNKPGGDIWEGGNQNVKESHDQLAAAAHLQAVIGDYAGAVELLRQCIRMKPDITEYRYNLELNLGRNYKKMGNRPRAEQHFQEALKFAPAGNTAAQDELSSISDTGEAPGAGSDSLGSTFSKLFGGKK